MSKKFYTLSLLFSAFTIFPALAQSPVLTSSNVNPPLNTPFLYQAAMTSGVAFGSIGENQIWDYSHLVDTGMGDSIVYVNPASTPGAQLFPEANLASVENIGGQHAYNYTKMSLGGMSSIGSLSPGDTQIAIPPIKIFTFPFSYGSSFTDSVMSYDHSNTGVDSGQISGKVKATGYGTLKLPGGNTYEHVLQTTDTMNMIITGFGLTLINISQTYFLGFANLLTIDYTSISALGTTETNRDVTYLASPLSLGINDISTSEKILKAAPNPTENFININVSKPDVLNIFSVSGKRVFQQKIEAGKNKIDVSKLPAGNYFGRMNQGSFRFIKK
ncbi:MAG TPA: T9SS type A sorting domain-containing protein [Edaphocola sp.]|nr:T9SS type A sorting domain-containing protein [Edaphocola sp.]